MFPGHIAIGVLLKSFLPSVSSAPIVWGIAIIDVVWGALCLLKIERVDPDRSAGPYLYFDLTMIDYTHSLVTALLWSALWATLFARRGRVTAVAAFAAAFSHWLSDLAVHNHDMALYPHSKQHFGCSLYRRWGVWEWVFEGAFSAACLAIAQTQFSKRGVSLKPVWVLLTLIVLNMSPWTSVLWYIAGLKQPVASQVAGATTAVAFALPCAYLTHYFDKAERQARLGKTK